MPPPPQSEFEFFPQETLVGVPLNFINCYAVYFCQGNLRYGKYVTAFEISYTYFESISRQILEGDESIRVAIYCDHWPAHKDFPSLKKVY